MVVTVFGIPNCDTVKKARAWLDARGIEYAFHDYKKRGADAAKVASWAGQAGLDRVLNKAGTTFRKLAPEQTADLTPDKAVALMAAQPSLIKRPIVEYSGGLLVGFREAEWAAALA
jgi:Spx/MgsR family transcriptional regulator